MAVTNATTKRGNYICQVGYMDIYQKIERIRRGRGRDAKYENKVTVGIYHAKHLIENVPSRNLEKAKERAAELVKQGVTKHQK